MKAYELLELQTGNLLGEYATEMDALKDVAEAVQQDGMASVETLALGCMEDGKTRMIAKGEVLAAKARRKFPQLF